MSKENFIIRHSLFDIRFKNFKYLWLEFTAYFLPVLKGVKTVCTFFNNIKHLNKKKAAKSYAKPTFLTISASNRWSISAFWDIVSRDNKKLILFFS